jgi:ferredoxin
MSRFGIRKRIRRAVSGRADGGDRTHIVRLRLPDGSTHEVVAEDRYTLVMASQSLSTPIDTQCPDGGCGSCVVDILEAPDSSLSPAASKEADAYRECHSANLPAGVRLACHARVVGPGLLVGVRHVWNIEDLGGESD